MVKKGEDVEVEILECFGRNERFRKKWLRTWTYLNSIAILRDFTIAISEHVPAGPKSLRNQLVLDCSARAKLGDAAPKLASHSG